MLDASPRPGDDAMAVRWLAVVFAGALLMGLTGCLENRPVGGAKDGSAPPTPGADFHEGLLWIAQTYRSFGQVDDRMGWAPALCAGPALPPELRLSDSKDASTHGQKLYAMFAAFKENGSYVKPGQPSRAHQTVVKESWVPEEVPDDGKPLQPAIRRYRHFDPARACSSEYQGEVIEQKYLPYARKNGKLYRAAKQADLFIMYKMDPETPGTDRGWVYGTVTADGKTVTSAGRVASCMKCHVDAPHDRLFGLPRE
jgi:hypothetical protein